MTYSEAVNDAIALQVKVEPGIFRGIGGLPQNAGVSPKNTLDEIDRWERAVRSSSIIPETAGLNYLYIAPLLMASTVTASRPPERTPNSSVSR